MALIGKDSLKANIIKRLGISGEEYLLPAERAMWDVINDEPPVQSDVPDMNVGDMIYRRDAIKAICEDGTWLERQGCTEITMAERKQRDADIIEKLPPVQPKHGKWIEIKNKKGVVIAIKCDKCSQFPKHGVRSDFCPNCGADMRGGKDGTD